MILNYNFNLERKIVKIIWKKRYEMKKVITYGTYDLLHYGHIRLLERAKALGDYLIVGVTADDFEELAGLYLPKNSWHKIPEERKKSADYYVNGDVIIFRYYETWTAVV